MSTLELQPFSLLLNVEETTQNLGHVERWDTQPLGVGEREKRGWHGDGEGVDI